MSDKAGGRSAREVLTGRASTVPPPNVGAPNLMQMTQAIPRTTADQTTKDIVAAIATDQLYRMIEDHYLAVPLYPDTLVDVVNSARPDFIVIDRAALSGGPWFGAEHEAGGTLIDELSRLRNWTQKHGGTIILVDSVDEEGYYTPRIREMAHRVFPSDAFWSELPEQPRRRAIYHIVQDYSLRNARAGGSEDFV